MLLYRFRDSWREWCLALLILVAYGVLVFFYFNPIKASGPASTPAPVDTSIKSLQLTAEETSSIKKVAEAAATKFVTESKTTPTADTIKAVRFEAAYNDLVDSKLKAVMPEIIVADTTVTDLVKSGEYDKLTQKLELEKSGVIKIYESQEQFKGKVGDTFRGEKVTKILSISDKDKFEDAKGFLVSLQALREIEKVAHGFEEG